ncbi:hypothetical protein BT63DRAFT_470368 [Microthyrium microscopicum]|uniref:Uncharacterized protein n=1 Tax=Microthyrium microscopicum TaxID=703497 RepID=A0A6A6UBD4_9PEZI|nr:hypothetical protein BT63DRAFT_470368 [Microthyrium microscopicum]
MEQHQEAIQRPEGSKKQQESSQRAESSKTRHGESSKRQENSRKCHDGAKKPHKYCEIYVNPRNGNTIELRNGTKSYTLDLPEGHEYKYKLWDGIWKVVDLTTGEKYGIDLQGSDA